MEIEQDCSIFDYTDIADIIFDKLDFTTIFLIAPVCKRFATLNYICFCFFFNQYPIYVLFC